MQRAITFFSKPRKTYAEHIDEVLRKNKNYTVAAMLPVEETVKGKGLLVVFNVGDNKA